MQTQDFEGQRLVEVIANIALSVVGVCHLDPPPNAFGSFQMNANPTFPQAIAFIVGYVLQDIKLAIYIALGGTALTFLALIPPWPFFNQHPVKWLPVGGSSTNPPPNLVINEKAIR
jgi:signal peptidase complex subunit 1